MIAYAWAMWVYRLVLFTGIAVMVYHHFFKALGIILFLVEILFFICLPIWREFTAWWSRRAAFARTSRFAVTMAVGALLLSLTFIPWSSRVAIPESCKRGRMRPCTLPPQVGS